MGRCRCLRKGEACKPKQTCCGKLSCFDGLCQGGSTPVPAGPWTNVATFGSEGTGASQFRNPYGVALSTDGLTAFVADTNNSRISVWTRPNASSTAWTNQTTFGEPGAAPSQFVAPPGIALHPDQQQNGLVVAVADYYSFAIKFWKRTSLTSTDWTYDSSVQTQSPLPSVSLLADSTLLFSVIPTGVIVFTFPYTNPDTGFGSLGFTPNDLSSPYGLATHVLQTSNGPVVTAWVADTINNRISVWTIPFPISPTNDTWTNQTTFGSIGSGASQFTGPTGVAVSGNGLSAWIADRSNSRISVWTRPSVSSAVWSPESTFGTMGAGIGQVSSPGGLAVSPDGNTVLVADTNNSRISVWVRS
ncbi:MAG: hypothetical protein ACKOWF_11735 [Chloroflexota bacterium]